MIAFFRFFFFFQILLILYLDLGRVSTSSTDGGSRCETESGLTGSSLYKLYQNKIEYKKLGYLLLRLYCCVQNMLYLEGGECTKSRHFFLFIRQKR